MAPDVRLGWIGSELPPVEPERIETREDGQRRLSSWRRSSPVRFGRLDIDEGRLTPELTDIFKRTFRGVHPLAYLKREECVQAGKTEEFERAADAARAAQDEAFGSEEKASN